MPLPQYPPSGPPNSQYYKVSVSLCVCVSVCVMYLHTWENEGEMFSLTSVCVAVDVFVQQDQFNGQTGGLNALTTGGAGGVYNSFNQPSGVRPTLCV